VGWNWEKFTKLRKDEVLLGIFTCFGNGLFGMGYVLAAWKQEFGVPGVRRLGKILYHVLLSDTETTIETVFLTAAWLIQFVKWFKTIPGMPCQ
jgi:hypothetical protein